MKHSRDDLRPIQGCRKMPAASEPAKFHQKYTILGNLCSRWQPNSGELPVDQDDLHVLIWVKPYVLSHTAKVGTTKLMEASRGPNFHVLFYIVWENP